MNKLLIVVATAAEIEPLIKELKPVSVNASGFLKEFSYKNLEIDIAITSVGMINTAFCLGRLSEKKYSQAINAGVCGSFNEEIKIGDLVNVIEDGFSEMGAENGNDFLTLSQINLGNENVKINSVLNHKVFQELKSCKGITVNTVHGNEDSILKIKERLNPDIESMEGAAFILACNNFKWTCAQIRTVSNNVEQRNKNNWNLPLAIKNLNDFLINYLNQL